VTARRIDVRKDEQLGGPGAGVSAYALSDGNDSAGKTFEPAGYNWPGMGGLPLFKSTWLHASYRTLPKVQRIPNDRCQYLGLT
jgi:hypothetical protein